MPLSGRGGARATLGYKRSIPPPRSAPAVGYPSLLVAELILVLAKVLQRPIDDAANLPLKLVGILPVLRERHPTEMDAFADHLINLAAEHLDSLFAAFTG